MASLDELKQEIREEASDKPDKFFATSVLREKDFKRTECENCGMMFWRYNRDRKVCGEPECSGGYTFINNSPIDQEYSYIQTWNKFRDFMSDRGYKPIDRYPVIARWRDDVEFVGGSIYNFQPHVVSGEVEPPAPELVVPQPSLRFNDIDNVGVTGRHYVLHNHIGQTCFKDADEYDQDRYFRDMFEFAVDELEIPKEKLILHEDSWGGGGNLGACMEFFVDGLELWNQVYMFYKQAPEGYEELDLKVLDMGMGQERITWISHGTETSYECVMPETLAQMKEETAIDVNERIWERFLPYSSELNVDEVDNIDEKWQEISDEMELNVDKLKEEVKPVAALYSVAEHSRALLFALADGKLPSNTGGGHNLRVVYRRAQDFIEKYDWDLNMEDIVEWHAEELRGMFPELEESIEDVQKILAVEKEKYEQARQKAKKELAELDSEPTVEKMIELYESHGVSPEMMEEHGYTVPEDFYAMVASEDERVEAIEEEFELSAVPETEKLYYEDEKQKECEAEVIAKRPNSWIILDQTVFYPEGGGQEPDHGQLVTEDGEKYEVTDVQKQNGVVLHKVGEHGLEEGDRVTAKIQWNRRLQLMQHHSTTHMVNGAAKDLFGNHIWQAGAHKTVEKGRLDVTHYEKPSREELDELENKVNDMITQNYGITKEVMPKSKAEQEYGFRIYQGGVVPGNEIRIVFIDEDVDIEACGGTHLSKTSEAGEFIVVGSNKVQDGVIRLKYKAGKAAEQHLNAIENRVEKVANLLGIEEISEDMLGGTHREVQRELCSIFSVQPDHLVDTVERFDSENEELQIQINRLAAYLDVKPEIKEPGTGNLVDRADKLFNAWKQNEKRMESLEAGIEDHIGKQMEDRVIEEEVPTENVGLLIQICRKLSKEYSASVTLIGGKGAVSASYHEDYDADKNLEQYSDNVQGDENFAKAFDS
jgi:alanyl-tRNA synthetase